MTVKELIQTLQEVENQDRLVVCQSDPEGNEFSPLADLWEGAYKAETDWYGEAGMEKLTQQDIEDGYSEEDVLDGVPAIMLVPTN
jgi:hypothetical protein